MIEASEITPLATVKLLQRHFRHPENWAQGLCKGVGWDIDAVMDREWGPPLVSDPDPVQEAKSRAFNAAIAALLDEAGLSRRDGIVALLSWERDPRRTHAEIVALLERAADRLAKGAYSYDAHWRLVYKERQGA